VSVAVRDQILRAADRAIAEQTPPNIFVRTGFPVIDHLHKVGGEPDCHRLLLHATSVAGRLLWYSKLISGVGGQEGTNRGDATLPGLLGGVEPGIAG
jgi:hypothetical protein